MRLIMTDCENTLLRECELKEIKRNNIALTYRFAMEADKEGREKINWGKVNKAIIKRWSLSGLKYIKERAWSDKVF